MRTQFLLKSSALVLFACSLFFTPVVEATNWIKLESGTNKKINDIAFGNGTFVAVGESGLVLTSNTNAQSWTIQTSAIAENLSVVAFGNGAFVAVAGSGLYTSTDQGRTWNKTSSASFVDVAFGNGIFVAIANTSSSGVMRTSTNGITWSSQSPNPNDNGIETWEILSDITFANGKFEVIGRGLVVITIGGVTIPLQHEGFLMDSNDGKKWGRESYGDWEGSTEKYKFLKYVHELKDELNIFVTIGEGDNIYTADIFSWTARTSGTKFYGLTWATNTLVAVGENGTIKTSGNGINWTTQNSPTISNLNNVLFANNVFFIVGNDGTILTSAEPPVADFIGSPTSGVVPLTVQFTDQSTGEIASWSWDFGDGQTSTVQNPSCTYQNAGTYTIKLTVTGPGGSDTKNRPDYINVGAKPDFTAAPRKGLKPLTVQFSNQSVGNFESCFWSFGDGEISTLQNPVHIFNGLGFYTVSLTVTGQQGSAHKTSPNFIIVQDKIYAPGTVKWVHDVGNHIEGSAAIGTDGTIYIGTWHSNLHAFQPDGGEIWKFQVNGSIHNSPAIGLDGTIYIETGSNRFFAINPDGKKKWESPVQVQWSSSPAIGSDGTIYVGAIDGKLYALKPDGTKKWDFYIGASSVSSSPAIGDDGTIYVGGDYQNFYAISPNGVKKWSIPTRQVWSSPAIGSDGSIYFGDMNKTIYAVKSDGTIKWTFTADGSIWSSPAIGEDGVIYVGGRDNRLYAINSNGSLRWKFTTGGYIESSSPAIGADGMIYVGSDDGYLYAVTPQGSQSWRTKIGNQIRSSPAIGPDGTIYIGSWDSPGNFYAIASSSPGLANSSWPKFHQNNLNDGTAQKPKLIANFMATPTGGAKPLVVQFINQSIGNFYSQVWDFGDGQTSIEINPLHTYENNGAYTVSLEVKSIQGTSKKLRPNYINISDVLSASFSATPDSGQVPLTVQFTDQSTGNVTGRLWNFGDGQTSTLKNPVHTFQNIGKYTVKLTVSGPGGSNTLTRVNCIKVVNNNVSFANIATNLPSLGTFSTVAWGDYDNDGDLDILLAGMTDYPSQKDVPIARVYRNDNSLFVDINAGLTGVTDCSACWGDYDNDGDLDILLAGRYPSNGSYVYLSKIYRNDAGVFVDITAGLKGVAICSSAWGDYDNDGDLDIILAGYSASGKITKIYRNDKGRFTDIGSNLIGASQGTVSWGDYDNDGDLDILLTGVSNSGNTTKIYRNDGKQSFVDIYANLVNVYSRGAAWGDYDNDGDLDILLAGYSNARVSKIYRNDRGTFVDINANLIGIDDCVVSWGDYDCDGDLDAFMAGNAYPNGFVTTIYRNDDGRFTNIHATFLNVYEPSAAWGDYDNDGDLDILVAGSGNAYVKITRLYRNDSVVPNTKPDAPVNLSSSFNNGSLSLSWSSANDRQTPISGLSYNLRIGTSPNGNEILSAHSDEVSGYRRIPFMGNVQDTTWIIHNLATKTTYYWSVQAIDAGFAASEWAHATVTTSVDNDLSLIPSEFSLIQNYPNPFNPETTISFNLPKACNVELSIYNMLGEKVRTLVKSQYGAGRHQVIWTGINESGHPVSSGIYFVRLIAGEFTALRKMSLVR